MRLRAIIGLFFLEASLLIGLAYLSISCTPANPLSSLAKDPKVLAFYYTWYGNPKISGRWVHWDEGGHNPDRKTEKGLPDAGTTNHPQLGLYDSNDPELIKKHLHIADYAGIDGFICTWWGIGDYHDKAFQTMLKEAEKLKSKVKLTVYYERIPERAPDPVEGTVQDLEYILKTYQKSPAFFKMNNQPVIFIYGRAIGQLKGKWREVLRRIKQKYKAIFIADSLSPEWLDAFDGLHEYNPVGAVISGTDMKKRYQDIVNKSKREDKIICLTVLPGYDDSNIGRARPIICPRRAAELYRELWQGALQAQPDWILICSFNEWHEGSEIEPSLEHKNLYILLTRQFARKFKTHLPRPRQVGK